MDGRNSIAGVFLASTFFSSFDVISTGGGGEWLIMRPACLKHAASIMCTLNVWIYCQGVWK
jgi:hypothetical protein